jgi:hypothetical protein
VPSGKNLVITQFVGRGTNAGYTQIGASSSGVTEWKANGRLFNSNSDNLLRYSSSYGLLFKAGATVTATCAAVGQTVGYHLEGFLVNEDAQIGPGGARGPKLLADIQTIDSLNTSSTCPGDGILPVFSVPIGKKFVAKEISMRGTNAGYSKIGEVLGGSTVWKVDAYTYNALPNLFQYASSQGLVFQSGSLVIATCGPSGVSIDFHLDGYLTE